MALALAHSVTQRASSCWGAAFETNNERLQYEPASDHAALKSLITLRGER